MQLVAGIGVRHQPRHAEALRAQRAQRGADATALGKAQQAQGLGRPGETHVQRQRRPALRELCAVFDDSHRRKGELREHVRRQPLGGRRRQLFVHRALERGARNSCVPLGVACDADFADAALRDQPVAQGPEAVAVRSFRLRVVASDQQDLAHLRFAHRLSQKILQRRARGDATRRNVRHRLQPGCAQSSQRCERLGQRVARQMVDVHLGARRKQVGDGPRVACAIRIHLQRTAGRQLHHGLAVLGRACGGHLFS